mmetsp:Transcript_148272/g.474596  ORF Transcript_148272/g.474596 Transcript_148272/m.474596 type:complete len:170 (+) Transcript_148272:66-575(+)
MPPPPVTPPPLSARSGAAVTVPVFTPLGHGKWHQASSHNDDSAHAAAIAAGAQLRHQALVDGFARAQAAEDKRRATFRHAMARNAVGADAVEMSRRGRDSPFLFQQRYEGPFLQRGQVPEEGFYLIPVRALQQSAHDAVQRQKIHQYREEHPMTMFLAGDHGAIIRAFS